MTARSQRYASASLPRLQHFDPALPTLVETDASDYAIGSVLSQQHSDGIFHPVAFDSRKLLPAELNYEIHDKELLAIVWSFQRWRSLLMGGIERITVLSDHAALEYFMTKKVLTRRQARWAEILSEYDFVISYRPGKQGQKPDALSRRDDVYPPRGDGAHAKINPHNIMPLLKSANMAAFICAALDLSEYHGDESDESFITALITAQAKDPFLVERTQALDSDPESSPRPTLRAHGVLLLDNRIAVPDDDAIKLRILRIKHDHPTAGHPGRTKTLQLIHRDFYWRKAKEFVQDYISSCMRCARNKTPRHKPHGLLQPLPVPQRPWTSLSMDYIEQLPSSGGFDSILVIVCRFSKMAIFLPTHTTARSRDLADDFLKHVFSKHGLPDDIVSDRGSKFVSKFWRTVTNKLGITASLSTAYHPQSDGQTERVNQTLEQYLRIYCAYQQDDWHEWLPLAEFAYNNTDHASTGMSPFMANYGFNPSLNVVDGATVSVPGAYFMRDLSAVQASVRQALQQAQASQKKFADRSRSAHPPFAVGDQVMLSTENLRVKRPTRKFSERFIGPFRIEAQVSPLAFKLALPQELSRIHPVFHISLLQPAHSSAIPGRRADPPGPVYLEDEVFAVKRIVDSRLNKRKRVLEYLIEWLGYEDHPDRYTWEPAHHLSGSTDVVDDFHAAHPDKPGPLYS